MAKGKTSVKGLYFDGEQYIIDKTHKRIRIFKRTGTGNRQEALDILDREKLRINEAIEKGISKRRTLADGILKFFDTATHKSIQADITNAKHFARCPGVLELPLDKVHDATLRPYIAMRQKEGIRNSTITRELKLVVRTLNKAARVWRDELTGKPWLECAPPKITMPVDTHKTKNRTKKTYPLSWDEQNRFFSLLHVQLQRMAIVAVNTGKRDQEICGMRWQDEQHLKAINKSVFVVWEDRSKNGEPTVMIPNSLAMKAINAQRGLHSVYVWPSIKGLDCPVYKMRSKAWVKAWKEAGLPSVDEHTTGPHNLRHTCGRRLRAAGVSIETRKDILGHRSGDITTHYSMAEFKELFDAVELITQRNDGIILRSVKAV
ncbi:MAG: tyrosine-type recombinase/integrase [Gammaproteobacteria bacterium]|nr:tyrosine-type recombinase/integrase [Gammaproteobacteria bacterium]